jgi:hypothetical protein
LAVFAEPMLKPPGLTLDAVWHPELPQSTEPMGMWLADTVVILILANVEATAAP